ncbi:MAG: hypothetical protein ACXW2E_01820 [Nitrososphaeraceae archaeon]
MLKSQEFLFSILTGKQQMDIRPINPNDIEKVVGSRIPDAIIKTVNELIIENWDGSEAIILQKNIIQRSQELFPSTVRFNYKWLNIESLFESVGWKVKYDKPAYNESYEPFFVFSKSKNLIR